MPITFGSVGDIISVCLIVKDLVDALNKSRGSSAEHGEIIRELWVLDRALLEVEVLSRTHSTTVELVALCETARQTVEKCRLTVQAFSQRINKYGVSLGNGGSGNIMKDAAMKIGWQLSQKDEVSKFRAEIAAHSASINMLLATASVKLMKINDDKLDTRLSHTERNTQTLLDNQHSVLEEVRNKLEENKRLISAGNVATTKLLDSLRLEWLKKLGLELKTLMWKVITINFATYRTILEIQKGLPTRLERTLIQEPFILEDAIGRIAPVHLQFIDSWDAFDAVLKLRFRNTQGFTKVCKREYVLQEHATEREIKRSRCFERSFLPGQRVDMSLIFEREATGQMSGAATCPRCQANSDKPPNLDIQCAGCGMWYRRVTEIYEVEPPSSETLSNPWKEKVRFGQSPFGSEPPPTKKRKSNEDSAVEDSLMEFKRIRLISKSKRIKGPLKPSLPFKSQAPATWPTARPRDDSALQTKVKRASYAKALRRLPKIPQVPSVPSIIQVAPQGLRETRHADASSITNTARLISGAAMDVYREVMEIDDEEKDGEEKEDGEEEDWNQDEIKFSLSRLKLQPGATLSEIRERYRYLMERNLTDLLFENWDRVGQFKRVRLAYEFAVLPLLRDEQVPVQKNLASEEDAHRANIPLSCYYSTWNPTEQPFIFLYWVFDAHSLGEFFDDLALIHGCTSMELATSMEMRVHLVAMAKHMKLLEHNVLVSPDMISKPIGGPLNPEFLKRGYMLLAKLRDLLRLCESHVLTDDKQDGEKRHCKIDYDAGLQIVHTLFRSSPGCQARRALIQDINRWRQDMAVQGIAPYQLLSEPWLQVPL